MTHAMCVCAAPGVAAVVDDLGRAAGAEPADGGRHGRRRGVRGLGRLARGGNRRGWLAAAIPCPPAMVPGAWIGLPGGGS
jgi:hypothetical protein